LRDGHKATFHTLDYAQQQDEEP
jgi:hypothetical protein